MTHCFRTPALGALLLGIATSSAAAQSLLQQYGEVVQAAGDTVAGLPGVTIATSANSSVPVMDLNGNMLWRGKLAGAVTTNVDDQAVFLGRTGNDMQLIVRRGQVEPSGTMGGATLNYSSTQWDNARISPQNRFLLIGSTLVTGSGTPAVTSANDTCIFWGVPGGLQVLAREGDAAPLPLVGATYSGTVSGAQSQTAINSSGIAVFKAKVTGGGVTSGVDDDGWLIGSPGGVSWMCRESEVLPGGVVAVSNSLSFSLPQIDDLGRVVFPQNLSLTLGSTPATTSDDSAMLLYTPGPGLSVLLREGDPAPGSGGTVYGTISGGDADVGLSRSTGQVVFANSVTGGDVTGNTNDTSIFAGTIGGSFTRIAREAEAAPTGVPGEIYQAFFPNGKYQINENGTVVFVAQLGPTGLDVHSDVAIFLAKPPYTNPGDVQMILREGQAVAGLPAGWIIDNTNGGGMGSSSTGPMLNDRDVVLVNVAGVGDPTQANWGIPAMITWDAQHGARAVYVQGDTFATQSNPTWTTTSTAGIVGTNSGDGGNLGFNNNGDICVKLFAGSENAVVRGHVGSMVAEPSSVPVAGGVPHNFHIDCGPSQAGQLYLVLATGLGSRPGFVSPFGGQTVCLNPDPVWTDLSLNNPNSIVWPGTLGFLDANGKGIGAASFVMPPGFPVFLGTTLHHAVVAFEIAPTFATTYASEPSAVHLY